MTLYEKNLKLFRENLKDEDSIIVLEKSIYESNIEYVNEFSNLIVEKENTRCFIHSIYDKERETFRMFEHVKRDTQKIIIFGSGLFQYIDYIKENYENLVELILIEPDLNLFKVIMNYVDIEGLVDKIGKVTFIINKTPKEAFEMAGSSLNYEFVSNFQLVYNVSYRSLYTGYFEEFNDYLLKYVRSFAMNAATGEYFLYKWPENIINNFKHSALPLERFVNKFSEIPIIIVSAGPSLDDVIEYLKDVKDKALIVAVGSAIKILDSNGIVPHFRMAFDASEAERNIFNGINTANSPLIFSDLLNHKIIDEYKGDKVRMVVNTDSISQYFYKKMYDETFIFKSGFSIANVALDVFIQLGAKKIIFVGQDLCYTEGKLYAKGSWKEENNINSDDKNYIEVQNILGKNVYTTRQFLGMKEGLEERIKLNPELVYINCTKKGLDIEGAQNKGFIEVMGKELSEEFNIESIIRETFKKDSNNKDIEITTVYKDVALELNNLNYLNDKRIIELRKVKRYLDKELGVNKLKNEIEYINTMESQLEEIAFYKEGIKPKILYKYKAIYIANNYKGKDKRISLEKEFNALMGISNELKRYLEFLLKLLKEEKG